MTVIRSQHKATVSSTVDPKHILFLPKKICRNTAARAEVAPPLQRGGGPAHTLLAHAKAQVFLAPRA